MNEEIEKQTGKEEFESLVMETLDKILNSIIALQTTVKDAILEKEVKSRAGRF